MRCPTCFTLLARSFRLGYLFCPRGHSAFMPEPEPPLVAFANGRCL